MEKKNKRRADEGQEMMSDSQLVVNLSSECIECKCIKIVRLKKLGRKESVWRKDDWRFEHLRREWEKRRERKRWDERKGGSKKNISGSICHGFQCQPNVWTWEVCLLIHFLPESTFCLSLFLSFTFTLFSLFHRMKIFRPLILGFLFFSVFPFSPSFQSFHFLSPHEIFFANPFHDFFLR